MIFPLLSLLPPQHSAKNHCIGSPKSNLDLARDIAVDLVEFGFAIEDTAVASIATGNTIATLQLFADATLAIVLTLFPTTGTAIAAAAVLAIVATRIAPAILSRHLGGEQT